MQLYKPLDTRPITWIDTPGHELFELMRGRTTSVADLAVVVFSAEKLLRMEEEAVMRRTNDKSSTSPTDSLQEKTTELLLHVEKWKTPVLFVINKVDLIAAGDKNFHVGAASTSTSTSSSPALEKAKQLLGQHCKALFDQGILAYNWAPCAEKALPMCCLMGSANDLKSVKTVIDEVHRMCGEIYYGVNKNTAASDDDKNQKLDFLMAKLPESTAITEDGNVS